MTEALRTKNAQVLDKLDAEQQEEFNLMLKS